MSLNYVHNSFVGLYTRNTAPFSGESDLESRQNFEMETPSHDTLLHCYIDTVRQLGV